MGTELDMADLGNMVRQWVHYDSMIITLNKQVQSVRSARDKCEQDIIGKLKRAKYEKAILQIEGGRILLAEETHSQQLSFKLLGEMLHSYFLSKPTMIKDETNDILKYIKEHRKFQVSQRLKRQNVSGSQA